MRRLFPICVLLAASAGPLDGAPPRLSIPYRGYLERQGVPVEGNVSLSFALFDGEGDGASRLWPIHEDGFSIEVTSAEGQFEALLPIPGEALDAPGEKFLQIAVDGASLAGRQQLLGVPSSGVAARSMPVGTIIPWMAGASTFPNGWLEANGASLSKAEYPALFAVLKDRYKATKDTFQLPDYQGQFLRGSDIYGATQPGIRKEWTTALPTSKFAISSAEFSHTHDYYDRVYSSRSTDTPGGRAGIDGPHLNDSNVVDTARWKIGSEIPIRSQAKETAPMHTYVRWLIRAE